MIAVGRVVDEETGLDSGAFGPLPSMVRAPDDGIIGDVPVRNDPVRKIVRSRWRPAATRPLHSSRG